MKQHTGAQLLAALILVLFTVAAADSHAQFGNRGRMDGGRAGNRDQANPIRPQQPDYDAYEQIDYRLSLLEEDLRLQPGQRAPWDAFAGKVRAFANDVARAKTRPLAVSGSAGAGIRYIEQATDAERNRVTALEDIAIAAKALYGSLNQNQISLADMRMPTIVAPPPRSGPPPSTANNLFDPASGTRPPR